ncbi:MAG: DUF3093 domain-containing protein [Microbacteriaceae bacterium]|nr:DUF3093 domain-containing protein [Microbacteriaceae bacterium]
MRVGRRLAGGDEDGDDVGHAPRVVQLNGRVPYRERLVPGPWLFIACALVIPAALLAFLPIDTTIGIIAAIVLYAAVVAFLLGTTPTIEVTAAEFRAGRAVLPREFVGTVEAIKGEDAFIARGQQLDARAYTLLRGFVRDVVRVENTDPQDPAPYWIVSTRHPDELAAALGR